MGDSDKVRLRRYLALAFCITWACWWGDALVVSLTPLLATDALPQVLFVVGGFGPTIAGCSCIEGGFSWRSLGKVLVGTPSARGLLAFLVVAVLETLTFVFASQGLVPAIQVAPVPPLAIATAVFLISFSYQGGNEEIGWRGTMQPILQKRFSFTAASAIVSVVWVCWHIPLWFIPGDTHQSIPFFGFAFLGIFLAIWLAAVYAATRSVLACMAIHGLSNTLMGVLSFQVGPAYFIGTAILTVFSIYVGTRAKTGDATRS